MKSFLQGKIRYKSPKNRANSSSKASKKDQLRHDLCIIYGSLKGTQLAKSSLF